MLIALIAQGLAQETPELNSQLYRPPVDAQQTLWADDTTVTTDRGYNAKAVFQYVNSPFVFEAADGTETKLVSDILQLDLVGAYAWRRIRLGLDLPVYLFSASQTVNDGAGLGDVALDAKGMILDRDDAPLGLALGGRVSLGTSTVEAPLGSGGAGWELSVIGDQQFGDVLVVANLGTRGLPDAAVSDQIEWKDQFLYRLGAGYTLNDASGVSLDLAGSAVYGAPISETASSPAEALVGGWYRLGDDWVLRAGLGRGLTSGIGSPRFRSIFTLAWEPPAVLDTDLDGLSDKEDSCPTEPEDLDGFSDEDGCPDPSMSVVVRFLGTEGELLEGVNGQIAGEGLHQGGPELGLNIHPGVELAVTGNAEGYLPLAEKITVSADEHQVYDLVLSPVPGTVKLTVKGPDGEDVEGILWSIDRNPLAPMGGAAIEIQSPPGDHFIRVRGEEWKAVDLDFTLASEEVIELAVTLEPSKIVVTDERIDLREKVYFDTGKATIKPASFSMLDEVAKVLQDHDEITKVRVEGHTDARGSASANQALSEKRAASVKQFLVDRDVAPERLEAIGYGEDRPIDPARTAAAYEKNRRVDIFIVERADAAPDAPPAENTKPERKAPAE